MNAGVVARREEQTAPVVDAFVQMVERAAANPAVDVDKLARLLDMKERIEARQAKMAYVEAFARMKPELPVVDRKGRIEVREKTATGKRDGDVQQSTPFARWEDIDEAITPILDKHGFVLSFRTDATDDGRIIVTAVNQHIGGHEERTSIPPLPFDTTGSKNNVQAIGSSLSYGKRYAATLLLNIRTRGEDDDGKAGGAGPTITEEQVEELKRLLIDGGINLAKFYKYLKIEKLEDLPAKRFDEAKKEIAETVREIAAARAVKAKGSAS